MSSATNRPRRGPPPFVAAQCTTQARYQHHISGSFLDVSRVEVAAHGTSAKLDLSNGESFCEQLSASAPRRSRPKTLSMLRKLYSSAEGGSDSPQVGGSTLEFARALGLNILTDEMKPVATAEAQDAVPALSAELTFGDLLLVEKRFKVERELGTLVRREDREEAERVLAAESDAGAKSRKGDTFIPPAHYRHPDNRSPAQLRRREERQKNELDGLAQLFTAASVLQNTTAKGWELADKETPHLTSSVLMAHTVEGSPEPNFPEQLSPSVEEQRDLEQIRLRLSEDPEFVAHTETRLRDLLEETAALSIYHERSSLGAIHSAMRRDERERAGWNMLLSSLNQSVAKKDPPDPPIKLRELCFTYYYGKYVPKKLARKGGSLQNTFTTRSSNSPLSPAESNLQVLQSDDGSDEDMPANNGQQLTFGEYGNGATVDERDVHVAYRTGLMLLHESREAVVRARKSTLFSAPPNAESDAPSAVGPQGAVTVGSRVPPNSFTNVIGLGLGYRLPGHEATVVNRRVELPEEASGDLDSQIGDAQLEGSLRRRAVLEPVAMLSSIYASPLFYDAPVPRNTGNAPSTARLGNIRVSAASGASSNQLGGPTVESAAADPGCGQSTTSSGWVRWKFVGLPSTIPYFTGSYYPIDVVDHDEDSDTSYSASYSSDPTNRDGSLVVRGSGISDDGFKDGAVLQLRLSQELRALGSFLLRCNCLLDEPTKKALLRRRLQTSSPTENARRRRLYWFAQARMLWALRQGPTLQPRVVEDPVNVALGRWLLSGSHASMKWMSRDTDLPRRPLKVHDVHMIEKLNISAATGDMANEDGVGGAVCDFTGFSLLHSYTNEMATVDAVAALSRILLVSQSAAQTATPPESVAFAALPPIDQEERRNQQLLRLEKELLDRHRDDVYCTIELYRPKQDGHSLPDVFVDPLTPTGAAEDFVKARAEHKPTGNDVLGRDRHNDRFADFHRRCSQQEYQCFVRRTVLIPWATPKSTLEYTNVVVQSVEDEARFDNGARVPLTLTSVGGGCLFIKTPQSATAGSRGGGTSTGRAGDAQDDFPIDPGFMYHFQRAEVSRMGYIDLYSFVRRMHAAEAEERAWLAKHFPQVDRNGQVAPAAPHSVAFAAVDSASAVELDDDDDELPIVRSPQASMGRRLLTSVASEVPASCDHPLGRLPPPPVCWSGYTSSQNGVTASRIQETLFPREIVHWAIDPDDVNDGKPFGRSNAAMNSPNRDDGLIDLDDFDGGADDDDNQDPNAEDGYMYVALGPMEVRHQLDVLREDLVGKRPAEAVELAEHRLSIALFNQYRYVRVPLRAVFSFQDICVATYYSRCLPAETAHLPSKSSPPSQDDITVFCERRRYRQAGVFVSTLRSGRMSVTRLTRSPLSVQWNPDQHTSASVFCAGDVVAHTALPEVIGLAQHEAIQELVDYEVEPLGHGGKHEPPFTALVETCVGVTANAEAECPTRDVSPNSSPQRGASVLHNRYTRTTTVLPVGDNGVDRLYAIDMPYAPPHNRMHIPLGRQERLPDAGSLPKAPFSLYNSDLEARAIEAANSCGHQYITCFAQSQIHGAWMASLLHIQHAPSAAVEEGYAHLRSLHGQGTQARCSVSLHNRLVTLRSVYRKGSKAEGAGGGVAGKIATNTWYPAFVRALQLLPQGFIHDDMFPAEAGPSSPLSQGPTSNFVMHPVLRCVSIFKVPKRVTKAYYSSRDKILIMGAEGGHIGVLGAGHDSWQMLFSPLRRWLSTFLPRCNNNGHRVSSSQTRSHTQHNTIALSSNVFFKAIPALRAASGGEALTPFDEFAFAVNCGRIDAETLSLSDIDGTSSAIDRSLANSFASDGRGLTHEQHARYLARRRNLHGAHFTSTEGGLDIVVDGGQEPFARPLTSMVESLVQNGLATGAFIGVPSENISRDLAVDAVVLGVLTSHHLVDVSLILDHHAEVLASGRDPSGEELPSDVAQALQAISGTEAEDADVKSKKKDKRDKDKKEKRSKRRKGDSPVVEGEAFRSYLAYHVEASRSAPTAAVLNLCVYLLLTHQSEENIEYLVGGEEGHRDQAADEVPSHLPIFDIQFHPVVDPAQVVQRTAGGGGGDWRSTPQQRGGGHASPAPYPSRPASDVASPEAELPAVPEKRSLFSRLKSKVTRKKNAPPPPQPSVRESSVRPYDERGSRYEEPRLAGSRSSPHMSERALPDDPFGQKGVIGSQHVTDVTGGSEGFCDYFAIDAAYNPFNPTSLRNHAPAAPHGPAETFIAPPSSTALSAEYAPNGASRYDDSNQSLPAAVHEALAVTGIEPTIYNDMYLLTTSCAAVLVHIYVRKAEETLCELVVETQDEECTVLVPVADHVEPRSPQMLARTVAQPEEDYRGGSTLESIAWDIEENLRGSKSQMMNAPIMKMFFKKKGTSSAAPSGHHLDPNSEESSSVLFPNRSFSQLLRGKPSQSQESTTTTIPPIGEANDQLLLRVNPADQGDAESDASGDMQFLCLRRERRVVETIRREYRSHRRHRLFVYCVRALSATYGHSTQVGGSNQGGGLDIVAAASAFNRDPLSVTSDDRADGVVVTGRRGSVAYRSLDDGTSSRASQPSAADSGKTSFSLGSKVRSLVSKKSDTAKVVAVSPAPSSAGISSGASSSIPLPPVRFSLVHMHWPTSLCEADVPPFVLLSSSSVKSREPVFAKRSVPTLLKGAKQPAPPTTVGPSNYGVGNVSAGHCVLVHPLIAAAALEATQRHHRYFHRGAMLTESLGHHLATLLPTPPAVRDAYRSQLLAPPACTMAVSSGPKVDYGSLPFYLHACKDAEGRSRGASVSSAREYFCPSPAMTAQPTTIPAARVLPARSGNVFSFFTKVGPLESFVGCCSRSNEGAGLQTKRVAGGHHYVPNVVGPLTASPSVCRVPLVPGAMEGGSSHVLNRQRYRGVQIHPPQYTGLSSPSFRAALYGGVRNELEAKQQRLQEQEELWETLSWEDWLLQGDGLAASGDNSVNYAASSIHPMDESSSVRTGSVFNGDGFGRLHSDGASLLSPVRAPGGHSQAPTAASFRHLKEQQHLATSLQLKGRLLLASRTGTPLVTQLPKLLDGAISFRYSGGATDVPTGTAALVPTGEGSLAVSACTLGDFVEMVGFARALLDASLASYQASRRGRAAVAQAASQRLDAALSLSLQILQSAATSVSRACTPLALDRSLHSFHMGCFYLLVDGSPPFWHSPSRRKQLSEAVTQAQGRNAARGRAIATALQVKAGSTTTDDTRRHPRNFTSPENIVSSQADILDICSQLLRVAEFIAPFYSGADALCLREGVQGRMTLPPPPSQDSVVHAALLQTARDAFESVGREPTWAVAPPTSVQSLSHLPSKPSSGRYCGAVGGPPIASLCDGFGRKVPTGEEAMLQVTALDSRLHGLLCLVKMPNRTNDEVYLCRDATAHAALTSMLGH